MNSCPCYGDCSTGCHGCTSSFCQCSRDEPNPDEVNCTGQVEDEYLKCLVNCDHDALCLTECVRLYDENLARCPCYADCPTGCPCPNYECNETIDSILILYNLNDKVPILTNINGDHAQPLNLVIDSGLTFKKSCSLTYRGRSYIYGGTSANERTISVLDGCQIKITGQLPFDFRLGACATTTNSIYLCFEADSDYKTCRFSGDPLGPYQETLKSIYGHSWIPIAASDG